MTTPDDERILNWTKVALRRRIDDDDPMLAIPGAGAEMTARRDLITDHLILELRTHVLTENLEPSRHVSREHTVEFNETVRYPLPATWWDYVKHGVAARTGWRWLTRRVRYEWMSRKVHATAAVTLAVTVTPMVTWPEAQLYPENFGRPGRVLRYDPAERPDTRWLRRDMAPWTREPGPAAPPTEEI